MDWTEDKAGAFLNGKTSSHAMVTMHPAKLIVAQASETKECVLPMSDYMECLHHVNEIKRLRQVKYEMLRQEYNQGIKAKTKEEMMELAK